MTQVEGMLDVRASARTSTTSARPSVSQRNDWTGRLIHGRGFAEYRCDPAAKLKKAEVAEVQGRLLALCFPAMQQAVELMVGFALNHNVSFRAKVGFDAHGIAGDIDATLGQKDFRICGKSLPAVPESHPIRRRQCSRFFNIVRALSDLRREGIDSEPCARSTSFFSLPGCNFLGKVTINDDNEVMTDWCAAELAKLHLAETDAAGLEEAGAKTPVAGDPNAEDDVDDQGMNEGEADIHPGAQEAAASGRGRGDVGKGEGGGASSTANKNCKRGPDVATENLHEATEAEAPRSTGREPGRLCGHE